MSSADIAMDGVYAENAGAIFCLLFADHRELLHGQLILEQQTDLPG